MEEKNIIIEEKINKGKMNFLKKMWYSITNFDKYMEMAVEGPYRAFAYVMELTFFMIVLSFIALGIKYVKLDMTSFNLRQFAKLYIKPKFC